MKINSRRAEKSPDDHKNFPMVSVIIPCYNHAQYLWESLKSAVNQTYSNVEVVVVDDGSTDNTAQIVEKFPDIIYVYQPNQGLSAARNKGIDHSHGEMLLFLDADDYLLPTAVETNYNYLKQSKNTAFISGSYLKLNENGELTACLHEDIENNSYFHFLQYNFIGMIATVLFHRWIFDEFRYDDSLRGSEDHDLFLKISRKYNVIHHSEKIAVYRRHRENMSNNIPMMVANALRVLKNQYPFLRTKAEKSAYQRSYKSLYKQFFITTALKEEKEMNVFKEDNLFFITYMLLSHIHTLFHMLASNLKRLIFGKVNRLLQSSNLKPSLGQITFGDMNRLSPFSTTFGFDRGGAIDRYYIENFLEKEANGICGRVLEIGDNYYTLLYGGKKVSKSDIMHVDESNHSATFVGDISNAPHIPDNTFDCLIFTQTLHLIYNFKEALQTCYRILKPGGTLLLTVPGITPIDHDDWNETWYWSFTDKACKKLMEENFKNGTFEVNAYGNVFVASAFLYGMGLPEIPKKKLDYRDPHFQLIITVKAVKN